MIHEYTRLMERSVELGLIGDAAGVLRWDMSTHLPSKANSYRASQLAHLQGMLHRMFTDREVGEWIAACEEAGLAEIPAADATHEAAAVSTNLRGLRRDYDLATKLPKELVEELAKLTGEAYQVWVEARKASDFSQFAPSLEKIVALKRREADYLGYKEARYDALMDQYEQGATTRALKPVFTKLLEDLKGVLPQLRDRTAKAIAPQGPFPQAGQESLNEVIARAVGYDMEAGRIDTTIHPFCTGLGPYDHRILTRYQTDDFFVSMYGILHETGHALYNQGTNPAWHALPAGDAVSLGIHESQSRLWENQVGRSRAFLKHWFGVMCEHLPVLKTSSVDELWLWANRVRPSYIRVEADEATYHIHIALRFEVEEQLINGGLEVKDVAAFWNERFRDLMGISIEKDSNGCLQDVHWCSGLFGYFPTYTLGSLNAAQLFAAANKQVAGLSDELAAGNYASLLKWLRTNVHEPGRRFTPDELMVRATGETTNPKYYFEYLSAKFEI